MRSLFFISITAALALGCAGTLPQTPESRTGRYLASIRGQPALLSVFLRQMPKGGELHTHLSGAVYAESYLRWAVDDGMCIRREPLSLVVPPCDSARGDAAAEVLTRDPLLYNSLVDAFSMRNFDLAQGSGHDHFFATFDRFDARSERSGDMLAEVVRRLARQNTWYVEVMQSLGIGAAKRLGHDAGWSDDLGQLQERLAAADLARIVAGARTRISTQEARMRALLRCGQPGEDPGCRVTVRYLVQMIRTVPREEVFAQAVAAVAVIQAEPRVVGLNLVAPEDDPMARRDYSDHMRILRHVTRGGKLVNVSLHAGELTPSLTSPEDTSFHIREAVEVAGARRIGHGTDIAWEYDAAGTLRMMAERDVAVEQCLTSAEVILGLRGTDHPFLLYQAGKVAQIVCTDDEGVSRTDLAREYQRALTTWNLDWRGLKNLARNALEYSFLAGDSLWQRRYQVTAACAQDPLGSDSPRPACAALLQRSDKAREQWRLEAALRRFEQQW